MTSATRKITPNLVTDPNELAAIANHSIPLANHYMLFDDFYAMTRGNLSVILRRLDYLKAVIESSKMVNALATRGEFSDYVCGKNEQHPTKFCHTLMPSMARNELGQSFAPVGRDLESSFYRVLGDSRSVVVNESPMSPFVDLGLNSGVNALYCSEEDFIYNTPKKQRTPTPPTTPRKRLVKHNKTHEEPACKRRLI